LAGRKDIKVIASGKVSASKQARSERRSKPQLLRDNGGDLVSVPLNGSTNTPKLARTDPALAVPDVNVNFLMLVPTAQSEVLTATRSGANINLSFQSTSGFNHQVQYKKSLTETSWTSPGSPVAGDGTIKSALGPASGSSRFHRVNFNQPMITS